MSVGREERHRPKVLNVTSGGQRCMIGVKVPQQQGGLDQYHHCKGGVIYACRQEEVTIRDGVIGVREAARQERHACDVIDI